jgi:hypothetical protein
MNDPNEDPTAWLGDPLGMHVTGAGDVVISAPPGERQTLIVSLVDAPTMDDPGLSATAFVRLNRAGAENLVRALQAGIALLGEHADS